jgi:hypothetical protein
MRVTFDTNTLDSVARPERYPKDPHHAEFVKVHDAVVAGTLKGHFSETIFTLEGIENKDRPGILGGTRVKEQKTETIDEATGQETINIKMTPEMDRKPLHSEHRQMIEAALKIGMRALKAPPRTGWILIDDPDGRFFALEADGDFVDRMNKSIDVCEAIESRRLGFALIKSTAVEFAKRDNVDYEMSFQSLVQARDVHEKGRVKRAVAEWADADSIAAHIGYGIDLFCTEDQGKSAGLRLSSIPPTAHGWKRPIVSSL